MDDALRDLWRAVRPDIDLNPDAGIFKYWQQHWKELGSPVGPEHPSADNSVYQAFTQAIIKWTPDGPEVL
jgi:hypothetical protein